MHFIQTTTFIFYVLYAILYILFVQSVTFLLQSHIHTNTGTHSQQEFTFDVCYSCKVFIVFEKKRKTFQVQGFISI